MTKVQHAAGQNVTESTVSGATEPDNELVRCDVL